MTERESYLQHIKRLQLENRVLRSVVAEERLRRQAAYGRYVRRLNSHWLSLFDYAVFSMTRTKR